MSEAYLFVLVWKHPRRAEFGKNSDGGEHVGPLKWWGNGNQSRKNRLLHKSYMVKIKNDSKYVYNLKLLLLI